MVECNPLQPRDQHYCFPLKVISGRNSTMSIMVRDLTPKMGFRFSIQNFVKIERKIFNGTRTNVTIEFGEFIINLIYII